MGWHPCPDEGEIPTDSQTTEVNKMRVKSKYRTKLHAIVLESIRDVGNQDLVLQALINYLPAEGEEYSLSDFIQREYFEVFEYLFEDEDSDESLIGKLNDLWVSVGLSDFGIPSFSEPNNEDEFALYCDDMEILFDEMDMKMKEFVDKAELILEYDIVYELYEADRLGEVCGVEARSKRRGL
jgi:hypothetical protein